MHLSKEQKWTVIRLFKDGSAWGALVGINLQEGHSAFQSTPEAALAALRERWPQYVGYEVVEVDVPD